MTNRLFLILFSVFLFSQCAQKIHVASAKVTGYEVSDAEAGPSTNENIDALISPYKVQLDGKMNEVIGEVANIMEKGKPESTLGNWVSDAIFHMANQKLDEKVDFAVQNYGGIRIGSIGKGALTVGKIYELMPFDNLVSIVELPGNYIDTLVNRFAQSGGWPVSAELHFEIENRAANSIMIGGEPLLPSKVYKVAMPDYIANGGDRMSYLKEMKRTDLDYLIRDALVDYVRQTTAKGQQIQGVKDGRIKILH